MRLLSFKEMDLKLLSEKFKTYFVLSEVEVMIEEIA